MLPSLATLLYVTLLTVWGLVGLGVVLLLGGAVLLAYGALSETLARATAWCARWLYPEYALPVLLGVGPLGLLLWALLR